MSKNMNHPSLTFDGTNNRIRISIDVLRLLGMPSHICLYNTEKCDAVAIGPCDGKNVMSFKVPEKMLNGKKSCCEIHSKQFVDMIMFANHLERNKTYRFSGIHSEEKNRVTFAIVCENI